MSNETIAIEKLLVSRFNSRKTRTEAQIERLAERIKRNGFEATRALWVLETDSGYEVFAGGTRLAAARCAGLAALPCRVFEALSDEDVARLESEDNENDEYHTPVPVVDVWAECHRLNREEGWTQARIAEAKGWARTQVAERIKWHEELPEVAREAVSDELLDEGHIQAISSVCLTSDTLSGWLTTSAAQSELTTEVLSRHRGSSVGVKPTVAVVRKAAKAAKEVIQAAESAADGMADEAREVFVEWLAKNRVRSLSGVERAKASALSVEAEAARKRDEEARAAVSESEAAKAKAEAEERDAKKRQEFLGRIVKGDSREAILECPKGARLMLTDPPYGMNFASSRRKASSKKIEIENDGLEEALTLLDDVIKNALPRMANDAHLLIFTGWRYEPRFREVLGGLELTLKGSLVWVKHNHGTGDLRGSFAPKHERILHYVKGSPEMAKRIPDVLTAKDIQNSEHPTEKPEELLSQLIEATTESGDIVLDPFAGSGSTLTSAHSCERDFWGCELDDRWHDLISDRLLRSLS